MEKIHIISEAIFSLRGLWFDADEFSLHGFLNLHKGIIVEFRNLSSGLEKSLLR